MINKIYVYGAGAIGSVLAAKLSEHYDVLAVGNKEHVKAIQNTGLKVSGLENNTYNFRVATTITDIDQNSVIFLTTKAQDTENAIKLIGKYIHLTTTIVCIQNGLGSEDVVRNHVKCPVVRAITYISSEMINPGQVKLVELLPTYFEKKYQDIARLFDKAGLQTVVVNDLRQQIWKKLVFNCVINGLGTILGVFNNQLDNPLLTDIKKSIVTECQSVAKAERVDLDKNILDQINIFIKSSTNVNSTLQDLQRGKGTEVEYLNGAIVKLGEKHGIATPVNKMILDLIKYLETNRIRLLLR